MSIDEVPTVLDIIANIKQRGDKHHPAGRAQDGRGALAVGPHRGAARGQAVWPTASLRGHSPPTSCARPISAGRHMTEPLLSLRGVKTNIGRYHILHGVEFDVAEGGLTMLLGRNGAARPRPCAPSWACGARRRARSALPGATSRAFRHPNIARLGIAYVPESMAIFADLNRAGEPDPGCALGPARCQAARVDFLALRGAEALLDVAGRQSVGRPEADAGRCPRHRRATPVLLLIDEPTKGLGARHHRNMIDAFRELKDGATSLLVVEQNFAFARQLGDAVAVMERRQGGGIPAAWRPLPRCRPAGAPARPRHG